MSTNDAASRALPPEDGEVPRLLFTQVSKLIDEDKFAHPSAGITALNKAIECQHDEYARIFLNDYTVKLVRILVDLFHSRTMTSDEKSEVRPCLESVMKLVSKDLEDANENGSTCHTLPSIAAVFAPGQYREEDGYMIAKAFNNAKGFHHLGSYLLKRVDLVKEGAMTIESPSSLFPSFHSMANITRLTYAVQKWYMFPQKEYLTVARSVMHYLSFLSDDELAKDEDCIVYMCNRAKDIFRGKTRSLDERAQEDMGQLLERMFEFYELYRALILKLIMSPSQSLNSLGWSEIDTVTNAGVHFRPFPRAYVVSGATDEEVNGRYEVDEWTLTCNGRLHDDHCVVLSYKHVDNERLSLYPHIAPHWAITKVTEEDEHEFRRMWDKETWMFSNVKLQEFEFTRPRENGWLRHSRAVGSGPTSITPKGLFFELHTDYDTLEHHFVQWIVKNDVLGIACDTIERGDANVRLQAKDALSTMLDSMKEVLQLVLETSEYHSVCRDRNCWCHPDGDADDAKLDRAFVKLVTKYLTQDLSNIVANSTDHDSVKTLHDILKNIHKSALFPKKTSGKRKQV